VGREVVEICVYGAEIICASCVNMPSSKDTYEWIEAAVGRKYPSQPFTLTYIDIYSPPADDAEKKAFAARVIDEDLFFPVIVIKGEIIGEGSPRLKDIYSEMEKHGYLAN